MSRADPASALVLSPQRLAAVGRSGTLDSPPEAAFDGLTRLGKTLLGVPATFMSIVDAERDFYKSQQGFPEPLASERELKGRTFCHYTLDRSEPLVIPDTHAEARWKAVPTVESLGVRAYLGVPVVLDGQNIGSLCAIDMAPRAWTETDIEVMRQLAQSATRELGMRSALQSAQEESARAQALARSREEIVAVVAHDLRTPLQVLQLGTHMLQQSPRAEQEQTLVARMAGAVKAMTGMAGDLLADSASLPAEPAQRQPVQAATLVADALEMMQPIAQRAGVELHAGDMPPVSLQVVYAQMLRVFGNVLGNAIKFSPAGGRIDVAGKLRDNAIAFTICDEGPGIAAEDRARVFERGWQGREGMAQGGGAGLGLAIVRRLVEDHGGTVAIEPLRERGTCVTLSLPLPG